jgi:hypothetical protein
VPVPGLGPRVAHIAPATRAGSDPKEIVNALNDFEAKAVPLSTETPIAMDEAAVVQFRRFVRERRGRGYGFLREPRGSHY